MAVTAKSARTQDIARKGQSVWLWESTSVKDPRYRDTMYVEELIGPDTVDTVPNATLAAFREHGRPLGAQSSCCSAAMISSTRMRWR
jgi:transaldolase